LTGTESWTGRGRDIRFACESRGTRWDCVPGGLSPILAAMAVTPRHLASRGRPGAEADTGCRQEKEEEPKEEGYACAAGVAMNERGTMCVLGTWHTHKHRNITASKR